MSVVIPTHRRPDLLRRCLRALLRQRYPANRLEILVVEDGGPWGAEPVVREVATAATFPVHYLRVPAAGPAAARNAGWWRARGAVVAFTDDDTVPHPGWLAAGAAAVARGAHAASGQTLVPTSHPPTDYERTTRGLEGAAFATCNVFCRRDVLEAVGGFDPRFRRAWREDSDLHFALLEADAHIVRVPEAVVYHPVRPGPRLASLWQQRNQFFDALLYRKHPASFRAHVRRRPRWDYFAIAVGQAATLLGAASGRWRPAGLAAAVWIPLVGRFFGQRLRGCTRRPGHLAELAVTSLLIPPLAVYWRLRGAWAFRVWFF